MRKPGFATGITGFEVMKNIFQAEIRIDKEWLRAIFP